MTDIKISNQRELNKLIKDLKKQSRKIERRVRVKKAEEWSFKIAKQVLLDPKVDPLTYSVAISNAATFYREDANVLKEMSQGFSQEVNFIMLNSLYEYYLNITTGDV